MRILVVCGAGASSTFVAQRLRTAAAAQGLTYAAAAGTSASLPLDVQTADLVLVGPHLAPEFDRIRQEAAVHGARAALLPGDVFGDLNGIRTLALVREALHDGADQTPAPASAGS